MTPKGKTPAKRLKSQDERESASNSEEDSASVVGKGSESSNIA